MTRRVEDSPPHGSPRERTGLSGAVQGLGPTGNEDPVGYLRASALWATALSCPFDPWPPRGESYRLSG